MTGDLRTAAIVSLAAALAAVAGGLECLTCGDDNQITPGGSCREFRDSFSWSQFRVACPPQHVCVKMISLSGADRIEEYRGCGAESTSFGQRHPMGCHRTDLADSRTEFCFCNTPLCNAATVATLHTPAWCVMLAVTLLTSALVQ